MKESEQRTGIADAFRELNKFFDEIDAVVEDSVVERAQEAMARAEIKRTQENNGCYCVTCLTRVADKANSWISWMVGEDSGAYQKYRYVVIPRGRYSSLVRADEKE